MHVRKETLPPTPPAKKFIKLRSSTNVWLPNKKLVHWNHSMSVSFHYLLSDCFLLSKPPWCKHRDAAQVDIVVFSCEFFGRLLFVVDELRWLNGRTTLERCRAFRRPLKKRKAKSLKFRRGGVLVWRYRQVWQGVKLRQGEKHGNVTCPKLCRRDSVSRHRNLTNSLNRFSSPLSVKIVCCTLNGGETKSKEKGGGGGNFRRFSTKTEMPIGN